MSEGKKITRQDLVVTIASKNGMTQAKAKEVIDSLLEEIQNHVRDGNEVAILGFGSFFQRKRAGRIGRNPQTGGEVKIEASVSPAFKPGSKFKSAISNK